jgi:prevent-host-death family protein
MPRKEKTISATEFKAKCLEILDHLDREGVVVSKRGKPIARVIPYSSMETRELIGSMKGKIKIKGDIFSTGIKWNAES